MAKHDVNELLAAALRRRFANGGKHLHSPSCIHNMPPEEQVEMRGRTIESWMALHGKMPEQITPDDWELGPIEVGGGTGE